MPVMTQQDFLKEEGILSPEKDAEFKVAFEKAMTKCASLEAENTDLKNENAELKEQLAWMKKLFIQSLNNRFVQLVQRKKLYVPYCGEDIR